MNRKIIQTALALLVVSFLLTAPRAPRAAPITQSSPEDRAELYQALLDLTNPWTVMCVAAHPDDEDGTSLIVMRRKFGAHTVSLFSTFGEGGQNAIGPELYEELGAIRARETMAAAEIQGSEPHFLGLKDFGYSKSADEAFKVWGHDEALRRMVLEIRKLRPDVIITNHSVTSNDHGHHQATARLELEAFDAAADPNRFPEQFSDSVKTWQVQRLFVRAGRGNQAQPDTAPVVTIDPNEKDPVRDTSFAEEALRALQKHATQGPWPKTFADMLRARGGQDGKIPLTRYRLVREAKDAAALPTDSHNVLDGLRLPEDVSQRLTPLTDGARTALASAGEPGQVLPSLFSTAREFHQLNKPQVMFTMPRVMPMQNRLDAALAAAAGIKVNVAPDADVLVPGTQTDFVITISNGGNLDAQLNLIHLGGMGHGEGHVSTTRQLAPGQSARVVRKFETLKEAGVTVPHSAHLYDGKEFGEEFTVSVNVMVKGGFFQALAKAWVDVAPPVEIAEITPSPVVLPPYTPTDKRNLPAQFPFTVTMINHQVTRFDGQLIEASGLADSNGDSIPVALAAGEKRTITFPVQRPPSLNMAPPNFVVFHLQGTKVNPSSTKVQVFSTEAHVAPNLRVGYVRGFDYSLPHALDALGVESKELTVDDVRNGDLQKYSTIIVDNRAYELVPELISVNQRLLDYTKGGGTLIAFYHKSNEWNPDQRRNRPLLAPYSLTLGDERITYEDAPITFIEADHPLLNSPNKMGQADFVGWIQERGLYYPKEWDSHYHALLQSNDPGEKPLNGGLLVADYGGGHYIYTSMVWYRQLRAGVPGAYRMLANMISYGRK